MLSGWGRFDEGEGHKTKFNKNNGGRCSDDEVEKDKKSSFNENLLHIKKSSGIKVFNMCKNLTRDWYM